MVLEKTLESPLECKEIQHDRVTAGGDDNIPSVFLQHPFVFFLDNGCTDCGFFHIIESELFECFAHGMNADTVVIGNKGRSKTDNDRFAGLQKNFHFFQLACNFLRVLRTYNKALSTENTFISNNMRLVSGESDRFYRTVTDTLVTVLQFDFLNVRQFGMGWFPLSIRVF